MLDAIAVWFDVHDLVSPGENWQEKSTKRKGISRLAYSFNCGTVRLRLNLLGNGQPSLKVFASLGNVLNGHNLSVLQHKDCLRAFEALETYVRSVAPNVSVPQFREWRLSRIEFVHDWTVEGINEIVADTAHAIVRHQRRTFIGYHNAPNALSWALHSRTGARYKLYNKQEEVKQHQDTGGCNPFGHSVSKPELIELATGKLRFEYTGEVRGLKRLLGNFPPTVDGLLSYLWHHGNQEIRHRWQEVTADWRPTNHAEARNNLIAKHGLPQANSLFDFWVHVNMHGPDKYLACNPINIKTFKNKRTKLRKAGVGFNSIPLPILTIPVYIPKEIEGTANDGGNNGKD